MESGIRLFQILGQIIICRYFLFFLSLLINTLFKQVYGLLPFCNSLLFHSENVFHFGTNFRY